MKLTLKWRTTALLALVALIGASVFAIKTVLSSPVFLMTMVGILILTIYGGWLIFTGSGRRLRLGWIILAFCLLMICIGVVLFFRQGNSLRQLVIATIFGIIYVLLINELRNQYWTLRRDFVRNTKSIASFRKPILIINPKSGDGRAIKAGVDKKAESMGIKTIITKRGDSIEALAKREVDRGADVLGVSGGDGTLGAVAKIALEYNLPLVVLPGGTRCHFARDAGFEPDRIADALMSFSGIENRVDVGDINGRIFLNNASFGLYADIVDNPDYRDHKVATSRKVLRDILDDKKPAYKLAFQDGDGVSHKQAVLVLIGINPYESLKLFELGHRKSLNSGKLQITAITKLDDQTIRQLMSTMTFKKFFTDQLSENFTQWESTSFTIKGKSAKLIVGVDGEREQYQSPVNIKLHHKKLRLMVPAEGMRPRSKAPFDAMTVKSLWRGLLGGRI